LGSLGLGLLALRPAVGLGRLAKRGRPLAGAPSLLQLDQLFLRLGHRPAFGSPAERLLDLPAGDREAKCEVGVEPSPVLTRRMLPIADSRRRGDPYGCHRSFLSRVLVAPIPNLSLDGR